MLYLYWLGAAFDLADWQYCPLVDWRSRRPLTACAALIAMQSNGATEIDIGALNRSVVSFRDERYSCALLCRWGGIINEHSERTHICAPCQAS